jgi:HSP20 family molecular chaperone IbpA
MTPTTKTNGESIVAKQATPTPLFNDALFQEFFGPRSGFWPLADWGLRSTLAKRTMGFELNMYKHEGQYLVECALPGFKKEELEIEVTGRRLTVTANAKFENEHKKEARYVYREREYGTYCRTIDFAEPIDVKSVKATYENGILKIAVPIPTLEKSNRVAIG